MRMRRCSLHMNSVIRWQWPSYTSRSESGTSESGTSDSATSNSDGLVSKSRGRKSAVWIYFGFEADEEGRPKVQDAVICRLCKKSVSAKSGNTSNLLSHLKVHLPQRHLEVKKANSKPSCKDKDYAKTGKASSRQPWSGSMHIPVYRDITIISNTNIEFPIPPNIIVLNSITVELFLS